MELISGEKPRLFIGRQVRDLGSIIADKKASVISCRTDSNGRMMQSKVKQSKIDRYTKTLQQASEALLELTRDPDKLSRI